MGIFSALMGVNHSISSDLAAPPSGGLSHQNPGDLSHHREVPLIQNQRPIRAAEAEVLAIKAEQWEQLADSTEQGFQNIQRIEKCDARMLRAYRDYQGTVAEVDYQKRAADVKYAEKLHKLRGDYGDLRSRLIAADTKATVRAGAIQARVRQILQGAKSL